MRSDAAFEERRYSDAETLYQAARESAPAQLQWLALHGWMTGVTRIGELRRAPR